jgi:hypothetical protein
MIRLNIARSPPGRYMATSFRLFSKRLKMVRFLTFVLTLAKSKDQLPPTLTLSPPLDPIPNQFHPLPINTTQPLRSTLILSSYFALHTDGFPLSPQKACTYSIFPYPSYIPHQSQPPRSHYPNNRPTTRNV